MSYDDLIDWDVKYAPTTLHDGSFIWHDERTEVMVKMFSQRRRLQHLLLHGKPGTGKSTISRLLPSMILKDTTNAFFQFNARSPEEARKNFDKMLDLRKVVSWTDEDRVIIVINEIDEIGDQRVSFLKNALDDWLDISKTTVLPYQLIGTCNTLDMPDAVLHRFKQIEIKRPSAEQLVDYGKKLLKKEVHPEFPGKAARILRKK